MAFAKEFEPSFYRARYPDMRRGADQSLRDHYEAFGRPEGRIASPMAERQGFLSALGSLSPALEIGPFYNPALRGPRVKYFDVLSSEQLRARAVLVGQSPNAVPQIGYVDGSADLAVIKEQFQLVLSSHAVEHQPDLVRHLAQVSDILAPGGVYALLIPDCRYCFDHFIPPSQIAEILTAHEQHRRVHTLRSVIEHRALTTHNEALRHWRGDHGSDEIAPARVHQAIDEWRRSNGAYVDVHAWQFMPQSFRAIVAALHALRLTRLTPVRVFDTPFAQFEFCAILEAA